MCPTGALDMDEWIESMIAATGKDLPMMMMPALDKAEKEGKFRRLIPVEKLKLDHFGYHEYKKHPRWIIGKGPQMK